MSKYVYEVYNTKKEYKLSRQYSSRSTSMDGIRDVYKPNLGTGKFEKTGSATYVSSSKGNYIDISDGGTTARYIDGVSLDYGGGIPDPGGGAYGSHNYTNAGSMSSGGFPDSGGGTSPGGGAPPGGGRAKSYKLEYTVFKIVPEYTKSTLKETTIAEEGTYPNDGIQGNYWYVKVKKAIPTIKIGGRTVGAIKYKDKDGNIRNITNIRYKDKDGNIRNLK